MTGSTGTIGSRVAQGLASRGVDTRALARNEQKAQSLFGSSGVEIVPGDFSTPDTLDAAMDGCDRVFLVSADHARQVEFESSSAQASAAVARRASSAWVRAPARSSR